MKFSDRYGHTKARESLQFEEVDLPLRNRLWTLLQVYYWDHVYYKSSDYGASGYFLSDPRNRGVHAFCARTWHGYYKEPIDTLGDDWGVVLRRFRSDVLGGKWYEVFNFLEWVTKEHPDEKSTEGFISECNGVLEEEKAAYRLIRGQITPITDRSELAAIDEAANNADAAVAKHVNRSLELLADRKQPDYRNSTKEAISAVEALAMKVTGRKSTLGQLLKTLDEHVPLHPSLKAAFDKLYGYTSDKEGVRHALMDQEAVDFDDAKFMLVTCVAFINYVQSKLK
jgi:AbiJ-like protein